MNPAWNEDEVVLALDVLLAEWPRVPDKHDRTVGQLSELLRALPIHGVKDRSESFRNPTGVAMTLQNLASLHPERARRARRNISRVERVVWDRYADSPSVLHDLAREIRAGAKLLTSYPVRSVADDSVTAGTILRRVHSIRERSPVLRERLFRRIVDAHGTLRCEACGWIPMRSNDAHLVLFRSAFEVHHVIPLARTGTTKTRLVDLVLLCATCHRLMHAVMTVQHRHLELEDFKKWRQEVGLTQPN